MLMAGENSICVILVMFPVCQIIHFKGFQLVIVMKASIGVVRVLTGS